MPESYAPPIQRTPVETFRPYRIARLINMGDADADRYIVRDIGGLSGGWRWAAQRPTVKVTVKETQGVKLRMDFTIPDVTFAQTGPVTVKFLVNDRVLDTMRIDKPGEQQFEKPVPAEWLKPDTEALVSAEIDKVFIAPQDGAKLGLILLRLGLTQ